MFYHQGGINVGDVDAKAARLEVPIGTYPTTEEIEKKLLGKLPADRKKTGRVHRGALQVLC